ncbi:MAG: hypothetical protein WBL02_09855 [Methanomethylovorans sp.]|uniref:hypothetical protein n=1 Tax=Methanomethylovorans sp. TaxID=2758717 RepID=UPI000B1A21D1|nr:hypothetical protein [Methanomethylovorans sp.]
MSGNRNIVSIIGPLRKPKLMGFANDSFTLIVTEEQSIFAKLTTEIMKKVVEDARQQAKKEGKGFFGQWGSQITGGMNYAQRYINMEPDEILKEDPANFFISNSSIDSVKIRYRDTDDEDSSGKSEWTVTIQARSQKLKFNYDTDPKNELKRAYGELVR